MNKLWKVVLFGLVAVGALAVIVGIVAPMLMPSLTRGEPIALIGAGEAAAQELSGEILGQSTFTGWTVLSAVGGIAVLLGGVPLILSAVVKKPS